MFSIVLLNHLSKLHNVSIISYADEENITKQLLGLDRILSIRRPRKKTNVYLSKLIQLIKLVEINVKWTLHFFSFKPKIVFVSSPIYLISVIICGLFIKFKLVYESQDIVYSGPLKNYSRLLERFIWKKIDLFIPKTESIVSYYISSYGPISNYFVFYYTYPHEIEDNLDLGRYYFHDLYGIDYNIKLFVSSGTTVECRHIESLINVFSDQSIEAHLIFIGFDFNDDLLSIINFQPRIHLHPFISREKLHCYLSLCDYGLNLLDCLENPNYYYSIPVKFWDYYYAGLYQITSNIPELSRLNSRLQAGLILEEFTETKLLKLVQNLEKCGITKRIIPNYDYFSIRSQFERFDEVIYSLGENK